MAEISVLPASQLLKLVSEFQVLHVVFYRFHNQHRVAVWWRYVALLHLKVRQIVIKAENIAVTKKIKARERLRAEACQIARYLIKKQIFKRLYYEVNSIIALGQFVTLGLALLGSLSALYPHILQIYQLAQSILPSRAPLRIQETAADDDLGEEIVFNSEDIKVETYRSPVLDAGPEFLANESQYRKDTLKSERQQTGEGAVALSSDKVKKSKSKKSKKDKSKRKKSAIDDIFG